MTLTKTADKFLCLTYAVYLKRIKEGMSRSDARIFDPTEPWRNEVFSDLSRNDYMDAIGELCDSLGVEMEMSGDFTLNSSTIVYMENRFKNGLKDVLGYVSSAFSIVSGVAAFFV